MKCMVKQFNKREKIKGEKKQCKKRTRTKLKNG